MTETSLLKTKIKSMMSFNDDRINTLIDNDNNVVRLRRVYREYIKFNKKNKKEQEHEIERITRGER